MIYEQLYLFDAQMSAQTTGILCGVDEAGRGPLAGPVACAAVVLRSDARIEGLNDSKKMTARMREMAYDEIVKNSLAHAVVLVDCDTIDEINILAATMRGMAQCVEQLAEQLPSLSLALVDGNRLPQSLTCEGMTIVGGDAKSACIAAASVLAKVTRDRYMEELDVAYPQYGFAVHKGYPTAAHYAAIEQWGLMAHHRRTFVKKRADFMERDAIGRDGERCAKDYLEQQGFYVLHQNYRSRFGEVDLIAENDKFLVFAEVKTRSKNPLVQAHFSVDGKKQHRIRNTALLYLQQNPSPLQPRFDVLTVEHHQERFRVTQHLENAF